MIWLLWKLLTLPIRIVLGLLKVTVGTVRLVGVDRIAAFAAGLAAGAALAPKPPGRQRPELAGPQEPTAAPTVDLPAAVRHELATSPRTWHLPQPRVTVHGDRVRLVGTVPHEQARLDLVRTAGAIAGVRAVDDGLVVDGDAGRS